MSFDDKMDRIADQLSSINVTLAQQHISLKEHMKRTSQLEERMQPIEKHILMEATLLKILSKVGGVLGLLAAVAEIMSYIKGH